MKGKVTMAITIGLICLILVAVMFAQFKTISRTDITALENMREEELRNEITNLKIRNDEIAIKIEETNQKIIEYRESITNSKKASALLDEELKQAIGVLGLRDVSGNGVIITLNNTDTRIVEAWDLLELMNELKMAGAEAISINDERIVYDSYIADLASGLITVNASRGMVAPYTIKAIGDPTYLESGLSTKQYGYIDTKKARGLEVTLERQNNIHIGKYNGDLNFEKAQ